MGFMQPMSTLTDVIVLAFLLGIAAAALIYLPMLRRARHRLAAERARAHSLSRGPNALRDPSALRRADSTSASATAVTVLATQRHAAVAGELAAESAAPDDPAATAASAEQAQANADLPTAPQPRIIDSATVPQLPTDLFQQHYEASFRRARERIDRIRSELP